MPPRKKGRKKNGTVAERKERLKILIEEFDMKLEASIKEIEDEAETVCSKIREKYHLALTNIPVEFHNLTREAYDELTVKTPPRSQASVLSAMQTKFKCMSEKKTQKRATLSAKKAKSNSKKSFLGSNSYKRNTGILNTITKSSTVRRRPLASVQAVNTPLNKKKLFSMVTPVSKILPASSKTVVTPKFDPRKFPNLVTPVSKPACNTVVTPKFDTRLPLPNNLLRKPRANEVIMSLSGSPLQNPLVPTDKPAVLFSVGGKVLNLAETSQLNAVDFDSQTKETLKRVQERLARMINN